MVVDEGDGDGDGDGVGEIDPPNHPPPPPVASQSPGPPVCHRPEGGANPLVSPSAGAGVRKGPTNSPPPPHSHMTVMWILRRLVRCLIRRKEGVTEAPRVRMPPGGGGSGSGNPSLVPPPCPMPEAISVGALPALNLLFDPRGVRFGTPHYLVLLQHKAQLGWVRQWRQGKAVAFGVDWATVLALPRPI